MPETSRLRTALMALTGLVSLLAATATPGPARAERPAIELYAEPQFTGRGLGLNNGTEDLGNYDYRDSVQSLIVYQGRWELCERPNFEGQCRVFGPGRHPLVPDALRFNQGSLRPAEFGGGSWGGGGGTGGSGGGERGALTLYEHERGGGRSVGIDGPVANLRDRRFNDVASSLEVRRGRWQVCVHADFGAPCRVFGPGRYDLAGEFQDNVSSARPDPGTAPPVPDTRPDTRAAVLLYEHADFNGREVPIRGATPNLKALSFNDEASSIVVHSGQWLLCSDADYGGRCRSYGPGRHRLDGELQDGLSSLRPR